jgi:hypothetical protein
MKNKAILGGILATIGALIGVTGHIVLFMKWYHIGMAAEAAEPGCEILLKYIHPFLSDLGILGGSFFAVSAYGFFTRKNWAFMLSVIGIILALLGSWFVNVPFMAAGLPPVYFTLFWPYIVIYFLLMIVVGRVGWSRTLLGMVAGMAYIFCFMNGIASTSRIITQGAPIFTLVQRLHWVAMLGWAVVTAGILLRPRDWLKVMGLVAGTTELIVGIPLAVVTAQQLGRFSLFSLAPISSLILVIILVWPGLWDKLTTGRKDAEEPVSQTSDQAVVPV